jgi:hypothetical protein
MVKIAAELYAPPPPTLTVDAIYAAYVAAREDWDSLGIDVGILGTECDRQLWYNLHWASYGEDINGQKLRLFETGNIEETRVIEDLQRIGAQVFGQQDRIRFVAGHVRGKRDGAVIGLPEAPVTEHLLEIKSSNHKNFVPLRKKGVKEVKPLHYVQIQLGMHAFKEKRAMYLVVNKNDDDIYQERVEYDLEFCTRILARAESIVRAQEPPSRISDDPSFFGCKFCRHVEVCHHQALPRTTCRSCIHSTAVLSGDAHWSCARWNKPLSFDEQKAACPAHLFNPALIPAEQIDASDEDETITYRLKDGSIWVDGQAAA